MLDVIDAGFTHVWPQLAREEETNAQVFGGGDSKRQTSDALPHNSGS